MLTSIRLSVSLCLSFVSAMLYPLCLYFALPLSLSLAGSSRSSCHFLVSFGGCHLACYALHANNSYKISLIDTHHPSTRGLYSSVCLILNTGSSPQVGSCATDYQWTTQQIMSHLHLSESHLVSLLAGGPPGETSEAAVAVVRLLEHRIFSPRLHQRRPCRLARPVC